MPYAAEFVKFAITQGALSFGEFTLKSGRVSPYFFNFGALSSGAALSRLGRLYEQAIIESGMAFDLLFGPAYKGILLASAAAIALAEHCNRDVPYAFNRKEAKDHGEGGRLVGAPVQGRVLIIDDVITAGTALRESVELIRAAGAEPVGLAIALDRQERGRGSLSAVQEAEQVYGLEVISLAGLRDVLAYVQLDPHLKIHAGAIAAYYERYGVSR